MIFEGVSTKCSLCYWAVIVHYRGSENGQSNTCQPNIIKMGMHS